MKKYQYFFHYSQVRGSRRFLAFEENKKFFWLNSKNNRTTYNLTKHTNEPKVNCCNIKIKNTQFIFKVISSNFLFLGKIKNKKNIKEINQKRSIYYLTFCVYPIQFPFSFFPLLIAFFLNKTIYFWIKKKKKSFL